MLRPVAVFTTLTILLLGSTQIGSTLADDAKSGKTLPSDKEVVDLVGSRMSKVFAKFGYPEDVFASDASSNTPSVFVDYGSYGFKVRDKVVVCCVFFSDWKGTMFGAKMGDSTEEVVKKLGKPESSGKANDGSAYMIWSFKEWDGSLEIDFDKDNKVKRVVVDA